MRLVGMSVRWLMFVSPIGCVSRLVTVLEQFVYQGKQVSSGRDVELNSRPHIRKAFCYSSESCASLTFR